MNKIIEEMKKNIEATFDGYDMQGIVENILVRVELEDGDDLGDAIWQAMDDELIYTEDQWTVIQYYMAPGDIGTRTFGDVLGELFDQIMSL